MSISKNEIVKIIFLSLICLIYSTIGCQISLDAKIIDFCLKYADWAGGFNLKNPGGRFRKEGLKASLPTVHLDIG